MTSDYLDQLNPQQRDAVVYTDGPQLVIAGAGSGKTRVLTYKIVHLLSLGYEPWRIMALTFTNKAAREMRERIQAIVGQKTASRLWMGTFHSIFLRLLRIHADRIGFKSNFTIYDASDSKSLIKTIIKDLDLDDKIYKPSTIASVISSAKNALISPDRYAEDKDLMEADRRARRPKTCAIYRAYVNRCFAASAMDFDDILYFTNLLLRDNPDILRHYQSFFQYVLIDEYQDTNFAQHLIATMLCSENQKFCAVGDDAQSIYSFRGANICNILNLRTTYPTLQTFKLEQNYRSTQNITNAANSLIDKNRQQIKKNVFSKNDVGNPIEITQSYSDYEEAVLVANQISNLHHLQHDDYSNYAILYRTNAQARRFEEQLRNRNIPYRIWGGMSFYDYKEVKDIIAYIRITQNPDDDEALRRIINYPSRGIGETTIKRLTRAAMDSNSSIWNIISHIDEFDTGLASGARKKVIDFYNLIMDMISFNASHADEAEIVVTEIIQRSQILSLLKSDRTPESISRQENIKEIVSGVHEFVEMKREEGENSTTLGDYLSHISLASDQDSDNDTTPQVTLMTAHASKGLEFNNIFITGVEEDLFPSAMSRDSQQQIEEERRLLYVAITRARINCFISYASTRFRNGQTTVTSPSRFIKDIDSRYLRLGVGTSGYSAHIINPVDNYAKRKSSPYNDVHHVRINHPLAQPAPSSPRLPAGTPIAGGTKHSASELNTGMRIRHNRFGAGNIISVDTSGSDPAIVVKFDVVGEKKLLLRFAKFDII